MLDSSSLTNHFLIAMPNLLDPHFYHSVIYICEHTEHGAMGIGINRPLGVTAFDMINELDIEITNMSLKDRPAFFGGPLQLNRGFVLHRPYSHDWRSSAAISDEISITSSRDILEACAVGKGPKNPLIALGYSGWAAQQLENEILKNVWLSCKADPDILFKTPLNKRWEAAAQLLGIDIQTLSNQIGHA